MRWAGRTCFTSSFSGLVFSSVGRTTRSGAVKFSSWLLLSFASASAADKVQEVHLYVMDFGASCSGTPALETRSRRTKAASTIRIAAFTSAYV
jgi:hypothetical protein